MPVKLQLTVRQQEILRRVVEEFVATGQPVGSKTLVERAGLTASSSTVRVELAELETLGLLMHPHTSAGRVPTENGYRYYADELLHRPVPLPDVFPLDLHTRRTEVESALQATTEMLSQVTRLLALVSAPPLEANKSTGPAFSSEMIRCRSSACSSGVVWLALSVRLLRSAPRGS